MQPCHNCQAAIDEYLLDKHLEPLRELTVDDFNLCTDCTTVAEDACVECGGAVYVPRSETAVPDYCPACRSDHIAQTGEDPGWTVDAPSTQV
jgi:predicted Zn-ribbon and HTH transcriptional regulator